MATNNIKANIQLWRAFACLCVFMVHFGQRIGFEGTLRQITNLGARGVQMFFLISGYLIANSFYSYGKKDIKLYITKKFVKLLPLYYIVILYYFIVHVFLFRDVPTDPTGFGWLRYLIPLNGILPATDLYFWDNLGITWTIPYFVAAYLTLPILLKYIKTYKGAVLLLCFSFGIRSMIPMLQGWLTVLEGFSYFCEGVFVYFACTNGKKSEASILLSLIILIYLAIGRVNTILYSFVFMLMVLATEDLEIHVPVVRKILSVSDRYSYTMYLAHGIVFIHCLDRYPLRGRIKAVIAVVGTVVLTYLIHTYVETPIQRKIQAAMNRHNNQ